MPTLVLCRAFSVRLQRTITLLLAAAYLSGCSPLNQGFLSPAGPIAADQRTLFLWVVGLSLVVVLPVIVLTPWLIWRYRYGQNSAAYRPRWESSTPMEILTWGVPVIIVAILAVLAWERTHRLDPYSPIAGSIAPLEIQVIAMDWKWLFIYPQQGVAAVNQLVIPAGRPVHLSLTSATVMQALLIPRVSGQIYAMAGMRTQQYLQADAPGQFIGRNTQFNGEGFQAQQFETRSVSAADFDDWVTQAQVADQVLDCERYRQLGTRDLVTEPQRYRDVQPGLFNWVVASFHSSSGSACGVNHSGGMHD